MKMAICRGKMSKRNTATTRDMTINFSKKPPQQWLLDVHPTLNIMSTNRFRIQIDVHIRYFPTHWSLFKLDNYLRYCTKNTCFNKGFKRCPPKHYAVQVGKSQQKTGPCAYIALWMDEIWHQLGWMNPHGSWDTSSTSPAHCCRISSIHSMIMTNRAFLGVSLSDLHAQAQTGGGSHNKFSKGHFPLSGPF